WIASPSADARALIAHAAGTEQPLVLLDELPGGFAQRLEHLTARRVRREPLQLILGRAPLRRLMLDVRPGGLMPLPATEPAVYLVRVHLAGPLRDVVDRRAGSGALGAAVLDEVPGSRVLSVESDPVAAELPAHNPERAGNGRGRVLQADLRGGIPELAAAAPVDAVLSNPPYIPPDAVPRDAEVREHDPHRALFGGGHDGLEAPRAVLAWARHPLRPAG